MAEAHPDQLEESNYSEAPFSYVLPSKSQISQSYCDSGSESDSDHDADISQQNALKLV